jgi:copper chaperone CopZ
MPNQDCKNALSSALKSIKGITEVHVLSVPNGIQCTFNFSKSRTSEAEIMGTLKSTARNNGLDVNNIRSFTSKNGVINATFNYIADQKPSQASPLARIGAQAHA